MTPQTLSLPQPGAFGALLRALLLRDQDPRLERMRWRLHLRLLLVSAVLTAGFFLLNLSRGALDETGLGLLATLGAYLWLRERPAHSRAVVRVIVALFLGLGVYAVFCLPAPAVLWGLLSLCIIPVFGALLDGLLSGGVAVLVAVGAAGLALATGRTQDAPLVVAFCIPASLCLYATSLAHAWLFDQLVLRQQRSAKAVAEASLATGQLARTLSDDVIQATTRLQRALEGGLGGLAQAHELREVLKQARAQLPEALPRAAVEPAALLDRLRASVHRFFLGVALAVAVAATALILWLGLPLWELAALVATATAGLLWLGDSRGPRWRWRLGAFLAACLASMAADVALSRQAPPAASLVFLPLIVFYAGMLGSRRLTVAVLLLGLALLALDARLATPWPAELRLLQVLALTSATMAAVALSTLPLYQRLLEDLAAEEGRLHASLQAYRRLVSTLFHDLANPLAVLQGLAALPADLRAPGDLERARRMVARLSAVSDSARFAAVSPGHGLAATSLGSLAEELADLFKERLSERQLSLRRGDGMQLVLRQGGSLLRDSILGNLLSNAIKYAPAGSVLELGAQRGDGGTWLRLRDQGPGFPAAALLDLARGAAPHPQPGSLGELGSGFGLLLAQSYARDLGGRLILSNPADGGAQAELWLPD